MSCVDVPSPNGGNQDPHLMTGLANCDIVKDLNQFKYPNGMQGPLDGLNDPGMPGLYRYDRKFLLQFMPVCTAKPPSCVAALAILQLDRSSRSAPFIDGLRPLLRQLEYKTFNSTLSQIHDYLRNHPLAYTHIFWTRFVDCIFDKVLSADGNAELCARLCKETLPRGDSISYEGFLAPGSVTVTSCRKSLHDGCLNRVQRHWPPAEHTPTEGDGPRQTTGRQRQALTSFFLALFKLGVTPKKDIHEIMDLMLGGTTSPGEERLASVCTMLYAAGKTLDAAEGHRRVDEHFAKLEWCRRQKSISGVVRSMIRELVWLREQKWVNFKCTTSGSGSEKPIGQGSTSSAGERVTVLTYSGRKSKGTAFRDAQPSSSKPSKRDVRGQPTSRSTSNRDVYAFSSRVGDAAPTI